MAAQKASKHVKLLALGTPVIDIFAKCSADFLSANSLSLGSSNFVDLQTLEKIAKDKRISALHKEAGDNARNVCDVFARLERLSGAHAETVAYAGTIGKPADKEGDEIAKSLQVANIDNQLAQKSGKSGQIMCLITPDAQRTFAVFLGVSEEEYDIAALPSCDTFFFTSITALTPGKISKSCIELAKKLKKAGSRIALAYESPKMISEKKDEALKLAKLADIVFLNIEETRSLGLDENTVGRIAKQVFLKKGADGSVAYMNGWVEAQVRALPVKDVVDTTGAGDAYAGAVLWALSKGQDGPHAAQIGSLVAASIVQKFGARLDDVAMFGLGRQGG